MVNLSCNNFFITLVAKNCNIIAAKESKVEIKWKPDKEKSVKKTFGTSKILFFMFKRFINVIFIITLVIAKKNTTI